MRYLLLLMATALSLAGCSGRQSAIAVSPSSDEKTARAPRLAGPFEKAEPVEEQREGFVIQAKYFKSKGPCIRIGNALEMPIIDAFKVVESDQADLKGTLIEVRAFTEGDRGYPQQLVEGKVYVLRLTPSAGTKRQLRENQAEGPSCVWINGDELEEQQAKK